MSAWWIFVENGQVEEIDEEDDPDMPELLEGNSSEDGAENSRVNQMVPLRMHDAILAWHNFIWFILTQMMKITVGETSTVLNSFDEKLDMATR